MTLGPVMADIEGIPVVKVEKLRPDAFIPVRAHPTDSGFDCKTPDDFRIDPGEMRLVKLGIRIQLPSGWECQMRARSSIATKYSVIFALGVGTIDAGYRGEIMVPFINLGSSPVMFGRGTKMSQMVFKKVDPIRLEEGEVNVDTERGEGGFGSTGLR